MELLKNIFFNTDKLIENSVVKISYTGKFFQDNSNSELYIHYGFGLLWENVNEIKMEKTELGYQALIYLNGQDSLNFCLKMLMVNGIIIMVKIIYLKLLLYQKT